MSVYIDKIVRSKRRTISIRVTDDGRLEVKVPFNVSKDLIEHVVEQKSTWVEQKKREAMIKSQKNPPKSCIAGERFKLLGRDYTLIFSESVKEATVQENYLIIPQQNENSAMAAIENWYKEAAKKILTARVEYYSSKTGIKFVSVRITGALTRWGSCSSKGRLCFTWRLAMAPLEIIDYVVVHELSHIKYFNHSKAFWLYVGEQLPDYAIRKEWLKNNSSLLRKDFFKR